MYPHSAEQAANASQLASELQDYDQKLAELLQSRWDPQLYRELSDLFDRMHMHAQCLPGLSALWSELLMSRIDLTHALWSIRVPSRINGRVIAYHAQHRALIRQALEQCTEYVQLPVPRG